MKNLLIYISMFWGGMQMIFAQNEVSEYKKLQEQGRELAAKGNFSEAIAAYDQAIQTMPYYSRLYQDRGNAKMQLKDYDGAIADFSIAIQKKPHDVQSYRQRGIALYQVEEYEEAMADLQKALEFAPYDQEAQTIFHLAQNAQNQVLAEQQQQLNQEISLAQNQKDVLRRQRRAYRQQLIWGNIVPSVLWTTAFLIWW